MQTSLTQSLGLAELRRIVREHRRLLFAPPLALVLLATVVTLAMGRRYTARAAFAPQGEPMSLGAVSGLAAQFGINVPGGSAADSPDLYAELVRSTPLLLQVARDSVPTAAGRAALADFYDVPGEGEARAARTAERLGRDLRVHVTPRSGLVRVAVRTRDPAVSHAALEAILARVNRYNLETKRTQARAEREFIETRLAAVRDELRESERAMEQFLRANREFSRSPALTFEHDRLERALTQRANVLNALVEDLERARLAEVRTTPVITVVEPPVLPALPDRRGLALRILLAGTGGLLIGGFLVLVIEWRRAVRD